MNPPPHSISAMLALLPDAFGPELIASIQHRRNGGGCVLGPLGGALGLPWGLLVRLKSILALLGPVWGPLGGGVLGPLGSFLGPLGGVLGAAWGVLDASSGHLGGILDAS